MSLVSSQNAKLPVSIFRQSSDMLTALYPKSTRHANVRFCFALAVYHFLPCFFVVSSRTTIHVRLPPPIMWAPYLRFLVWFQTSSHRYEVQICIELAWII